jgi:hypothetical protein
MGREDLQVTPPHSLNAWWKRLQRLADRSHRRSFDGMILFFFGIFGKKGTEECFRMPKKKDEVAIMTKVDVELYHSATPSKDPRC